MVYTFLSPGPYWRYQVHLDLYGPWTCPNQVHWKSPLATSCTHVSFFPQYKHLFISSIPSYLTITKSPLSLSLFHTLTFSVLLFSLLSPSWNNRVGRKKRVSKMRPKDGFFIKGTILILVYKCVCWACKIKFASYRIIACTAQLFRTFLICVIHICLY